ncbi:putative Ig domain-containing protein [Corynebacterium jeddahense]|uniref:Ig domain protein n=1 Tax=Corynebacterium jeddahense TaxID=1414719 RepID=A0ABY7UMU5_9CORY|nr:putative Ig domain-containing protein [Corynebacterium jeddahense]WCZ39709.1 Putative Ig domain protein [Corynebacterium jeddahense]
MSNREEIIRGLDPTNADTDGDGINDGDEINRGLNPKVKDAPAGTIRVQGAFNGTVGTAIDAIEVTADNATVALADGAKLPDGLTFKDGKITGTPTKAGEFKVTFTSTSEEGKVLDTREVTFKIADKAAGTTTATATQTVEPKCIAASVNLGIPLIALIPIGLATQMAIPGLTPVVEQVSVQIEQANAQLQRQLGISNPSTAVQVAEIDAQLRKFGLDVATVGAGLALIAAGIRADTIIFEACGPDDMKSSVEDPRLEGSSGNTYRSSERSGKLTTSKAAPTTTPAGK